MSNSRSPRNNASRSPSKSRSRSKSNEREDQGRSVSRSRSRSYRRRSRSGQSKSRSRSRSYRGRRSSRGRSRSPMSSRKRHIGDREDPPTSKCIGIFGLSLYTTEKDLRDVFSKYGHIANVKVVMDQKTGRSRGFAFVYYEHEDDAAEAKERANGFELDGRRMRVDFSITKRAHTPTPGQYFGSRPAPREWWQSGERGGGAPYGSYGGRRSPSPYRRRSPSPYRSRRRRSPSPADYHRRHREFSRRSRSPYYSSRRRSPSPAGYHHHHRGRSPSPPRRRSPSPAY